MVHPVLESRLGAGSALLRQANALHAALEEGILEVGGAVWIEGCSKAVAADRGLRHGSPDSQTLHGAFACCLYSLADC